MRSLGGFHRISGGGRVQLSLEVPIAEPIDCEVTGQCRGEESDGSQGDGVKGGNTRTGSGCCRLTKSVQFADGFAGQRHAGQGLQETSVGGMGHLGVTPEGAAMLV